MKAKHAGQLVDQCANMAARSGKITSYVIAFSDRDGSVTYHRNGRFAEQIGLLEMVKERCKAELSAGTREVEP